MPVYHLEGPPTSKVSRAEAEAKLQRHPAMPKDAEYDLWDQGGRWTAAWHQAGPPPFGPPADDDEEAPGPKSEGPDDTAPESPDAEKEPKDELDEGGEESPEGEDGPPKEDKEKGEKGKGEDIKLDHEIYDLLQKIVVALGISDGGPEDSPVPGEEEAPPNPQGPPVHPPGGAGGPPPGGDKHPAPPLKQGEVPPGGTPVGAPAFSSVADDHPWKGLVGKVASFSVEEQWPTDRPVAEFEALARRVAHGTGFKVKQTQRATDEDGNPTVRALISSH